MKIKYKWFIKSIILALLLTLSMTFTVFADPPGEPFSTEEAKDLSFLDETTKVVYKANDGNLYKAEPEELFNYLKKNHGDETYVLDDSMQWKDVETAFDSIDASVFGNQIGQSYQTYLVSLTAGSILTFKTEDLEAILKYYNYIGPIAFSLCLLYALLDLLNKSQAELKSIESLIFCLFKFAVGVFFVTEAPQIAEFAYNLSNDALNQFIGVGSQATDIGNIITESELVEIAMKADANGWMASLGQMVTKALSGIFFGLLGSLSILIISVMCYARKLEMGIRTVFLPIALADISGSGTTGRGMGYMKKMVALALQGAGIIFVCKLGTEIAASGSGSIGASIVIPFAMVGSIATVKRILEEASGA